MDFGGILIGVFYLFECFSRNSNFSGFLETDESLETERGFHFEY